MRPDSDNLASLIDPRRHLKRPTAVGIDDTVQISNETVPIEKRSLAAERRASRVANHLPGIVDRIRPAFESQASQVSHGSFHINESMLGAREGGSPSHNLAGI